MKNIEIYHSLQMVKVKSRHESVQCFFYLLLIRMDNFGSEAVKAFVLTKNDLIKYLLAGLVLTCGMAWRDAFNNAINIFYPNIKDEIIPKFMYAIAITVTITILAAYVFKGHNHPQAIVVPL